MVKLVFNKLLQFKTRKTNRFQFERHDNTISNFYIELVETKFDGITKSLRQLLSSRIAYKF